MMTYYVWVEFWHFCPQQIGPLFHPIFLGQNQRIQSEFFTNVALNYLLIYYQKS